MSVSISPHTCVEYVDKYNVMSVFGGVCGERLTDNADIQRCVCMVCSVWRHTDRQYRHTTLCVYLVECVKKHRQRVERHRQSVEKDRPTIQTVLSGYD